ncbi:MAG: hypothetical protein AAF804_00090 [Bacteroidota bacterium]
MKYLFLPIIRTFLFLLASMVMSCASLPLMINESYEPERVHICISFDEGFPLVLQREFEQAYLEFLDEVRDEGWQVEVIACVDSPRDPFLTLRFTEADLVTPWQELAGAAISVAGLGVIPYLTWTRLNFFFPFYYLPDYWAEIYVELHGDLALHQNVTLVRTLERTAWFRSYSGQVKVLGKDFKRFLFVLCSEMKIDET